MQVQEMLSMIAGAGTLVAAGALLVLVVSVQKLAEGSVMAESTGYVVAASLSLATSVLLAWIERFVDPASGSEVVLLASDLLVALAVVLFAVYFLRVRATLKKFIAGSEQLLEKMHAADADEGD
jgi:hypothetical protein